jgi:hypothetical protein
LKVYETPKFQKLRKKLQSASEKEALKQAIRAVLGNPLGGKKLKGELKVSDVISSLWMGRNGG